VPGSKKRNFGVNGRVIMFYARRTATAPMPKKTKPKADYSEIMDGLKTLGLVRSLRRRSVKRSGNSTQEGSRPSRTGR